MARIINLAISALEALFSDATADAAFLFVGVVIGAACGLIVGYGVAAVGSAAIVAGGGVALTFASANATAAIVAILFGGAVAWMAR